MNNEMIEVISKDGDVYEVTKEVLDKKISEGTVVKCDDCGKYIEKEVSKYLDKYEKCVCKDCLEKNYTVCTDCGEYIDNDDGMTYVEHYGEVCQECLDDGDFYHCEDCNNWYKNGKDSRYYIENYGDVCCHCYRYGDYAECGDCGNYFITEDMWYSEYDEEYYCNRCEEYHRQDKNIRNYNTRIEDVPNIKLFQKTEKEQKTKKEIKLFYGIELEVEANGNLKETTNNVLDTLGKSNVILKHDGSLDEDYGFEIVTAPMTFNRHREFWNKQKFFSKHTDRGNWVAEGLSSWNTDGRCGIHIHFSRNAISNNDLCRFVFFINESGNQKLVKAVAGRGSNNYCEIKQKNIEDLNKVKETGKYMFYNRYEAVNLENTNTVELRIFKGNVEKIGFMKNLDFIDSVIRFVKNKPFMKLYWKEYLKYVYKYRSKYKYLNTWLQNKYTIYNWDYEKEIANYYKNLGGK